MAVSVENYREFKELTEKYIKQSGSYLDSMFIAWLNQTINDIERTVPLQYCRKTKEFDLTLGGHKLALPGLIQGKEHDWEVSVMVTGHPDPEPVYQGKEFRAGMDRTYSADEYGIPCTYFPYSIEYQPDGETPAENVPGMIMLLSLIHI